MCTLSMLNKKVVSTWNTSGKRAPRTALMYTPQDKLVDPLTSPVVTLTKSQDLQLVRPGTAEVQ